jgi:hypothetical protein
MQTLQKNAWVFLFVVGLFFLYYGINNVYFIPRIACTDPDRGWAWLTCDPAVIEYIVSWFVRLGTWVLGVATFTLFISATGYRRGERWPGGLCGLCRSSSSPR